MKIKVLFFSLFLSLNVFCQNVSNICIEPVVPEQIKDLDAASLQILKSRMEAIATSNGVSSIYNGTFVMVPRVIITNHNLVEGGIRNIHQVEIEVSLSIYQYSTKTLFSSHTINLQGNGYTHIEGVKNALRKINASDPGVVAWIVGCRDKICNYYKVRYSEMIHEARSMASRGEYENAIGLLATYPSGIEGYENIIDEEISIYLQCTRKQCSIIVNQAKTAIIEQNYDLALQILNDVDPEGTCKEELNELQTRIDKELQAQREAEARAEERAHQEELQRERLERRMVENQRIREAQIRKTRLGVIQGIANSFFECLPKVLSVFF